MFGNMRSVLFKFILRQFVVKSATPILGAGEPHVHNACLLFKYNACLLYTFRTASANQNSDYAQ